MKYVLYLFAVVCLVGARGCPSGRVRSVRAILEVESTAARELSPSSTFSAQKAGAEVAIGKVISHSQGGRFRAEVAKAVGTSEDTIAAATLRKIGDTRLVEVEINLADRELAAKVVNAVARRLAEDFQNHPDVAVRVIDYAEYPAPTEEVKEK